MNTHQNTSDKIEGLGGEQYLSVELEIPPNDRWGAVKRIVYNNHSYVLGKDTEASILTEINSYSPGLYSKKVQGTISKEKGHFPNPMAGFDVFHVHNMKE